MQDIRIILEESLYTKNNFVTYNKKVFCLNMSADDIDKLIKIVQEFTSTLSDGYHIREPSPLNIPVEYEREPVWERLALGRNFRALAEKTKSASSSPPQDASS